MPCDVPAVCIYTLIYFMNNQLFKYLLFWSPNPVYNLHNADHSCRLGFQLLISQNMQMTSRTSRSFICAFEAFRPAQGFQAHFLWAFWFIVVLIVMQIKANVNGQINTSQALTSLLLQK